MYLIDQGEAARSPRDGAKERERLGLRLRLRLRLGGGAGGESLLVATPGSVHGTFIELQLLMPQRHVHIPPA